MKPGKLTIAVLLLLDTSQAFAAEHLAVLQNKGFNPSALAAANPAPAEAQELETVSVRALKDPATLSYGKALKALAVFERHHGLAPYAPPRFMLRLRPRQTDPGSDALSLRLLGNESSEDIPLASDRSFSLPQDRKVPVEEADLVLNRKKGSYGILPHIRSPGVPAHARRLGDLRLECEMMWALGRDEVNFLLRNGLEALGGPCRTSLSKVGFPAPRQLAGVTLVSGSRREALPPARILADGHGFAPPLYDSSWPDDAIVEFEFSPQADAESTGVADASR